PSQRAGRGRRHQGALDRGSRRGTVGTQGKLPPKGRGRTARMSGTAPALSPAAKRRRPGKAGRTCEELRDGHLLPEAHQGGEGLVAELVEVRGVRFEADWAADHQQPRRLLHPPGQGAELPGSLEVAATTGWKWRRDTGKIFDMTTIAVLEPREVPLGGYRAMIVRRTLPHKERT